MKNIPAANFTAPVAAPVSACFAIHLSAQHTSTHASQQVLFFFSWWIDHAQYRECPWHEFLSPEGILLVLLCRSTFCQVEEPMVSKEGSSTQGFFKKI